MDEAMAGKIAVVTGSTGGIGLYTAIGLAKAGADVVLVGRSQRRLEAAARLVAGRGGTGNAPVLELADFASLVQVRDLGRRLAARLPRLDVLVNNAGMVAPRRALSADGFELTFAVNHLAPFVLTYELLPLLRAATHARIVNLSSTAHTRGNMAWDDLMGARGYAPMRAYAQSKLANALFTLELSRRLAGTGVTANSVHPGVVGTGFGDVGGVFGFGWRLLKPFLLTSEQGAATSLHVAMTPGLAGVSGQYFARSRPVLASPAARDAASAARLWRESEALVARALERAPT